jgi:hypothetical protein
MLTNRLGVVALACDSSYQCLVCLFALNVESSGFVAAGISPRSSYLHILFILWHWGLNSGPIP